MAVVETALLIGSLLGNFFGKKKKADEARQVQMSNDANTNAYNTAEAARQDALNANNTDVANQTSAANERTRVARSKLAQMLLAGLSPGASGGMDLSKALEGRDNYNAINYKGAPATPVKPVDKVVNPGTGMIWDALSGVAGAVGSTMAESRIAKDADAERLAAGGLGSGLWNKKKTYKSTAKPPIVAPPDATYE